MKRSRAWILCILLLAAGLRLFGSQAVPPGIEHDEVANWLIDRSILEGRHAVYFTQAYGHEAGYHYLQAASVALLGDHPLSLRLPTIYLSLIGLAVSYAFARTLFGERVALFQAASLAVLFWPLFYARLGLRAISLPAVAGLAAWFFWRGVVNARGRVSRDAVLAGVFAGLAMYTYMAARAVPIIFLLFSLYLLISQRDKIVDRWRSLATFWALGLLVAAPLNIYLAGHPGAEFRISEINQPLNALLAGNLRPVLENGLRLVGFFGWRGDPLVRQNVPGRPVFDWLTAALFYVGLALAAWRWRQPHNAFVLIWLGVSLTPSLVTADAPSSIRCINALLVLGVFVGVTMESLPALHRWLTPLLVIWLAGNCLWTGVDYFSRWPAEPEIQFVWQTALRNAAANLEGAPPAANVVVAGWTPETMDPPTLELYLKRDDLELRFLDPTSALLWPAGGGLLVRPTVLPFDEGVRSVLDLSAAETRDGDGYVLYSLVEQPASGWLGAPVTFSGGIRFEGYLFRPIAEGALLVTVWRAAGPVMEPLRVFVHMLASDGTIAGQHDGLGAPARYWQAGDLIFQVHRIALPPGQFVPRCGLYNPLAGVRLRVMDAPEVDSIDLERIAVP